jgi:hypothetical protein
MTAAHAVLHAASVRLAASARLAAARPLRQYRNRNDQRHDSKPDHRFHGTSIAGEQ